MKTKKTSRAKSAVRGQRAGAVKLATQGKAPSSAPVVSASLNIKSILVPIDFSPESEKALAYAAPLARHFVAKLKLLHVVEPVPTPDFSGAFPLAMENQQVAANCQDLLRRAIKDLNIEPELVEKTLVRYGRAFHEITDAARSLKSDLVIISTHGHTGLKRVLLGSTTERVVRHAPCPALVVRSSEHEFVVR